MASAVRLVLVADDRQDQAMKRAGRWVGLVVGIELILSGCSAQPGALSAKDNIKSLPFNDSSHGDGASPTQAFASSNIPAGTAIVVRLQAVLSSAESHAGDTFQAVLVEPVVVQGQTLAPSGTVISGRIMAVRASQPLNPGFLRLTLSSILLNGKPLGVHTSSVFSKGGHRKNLGSSAVAANDVQFSTGRRLTFRLIEPLPLPG